MKTVMAIIGAIALVGGIGLFAAAAITARSGLALATLYAVLSVAAFAFAGVMMLAINLEDDDKK